MSGNGRADAAFLHNVPTSISSSATSTTSSLTSKSSASSTTSTSISSLIASTTVNAVTSAAASSTSSSTSAEPTSTSIYIYNPSTTLAIAFWVIYATLIPYHFYLSVHKPLIAKTVTQKHKYTIPLVIAALLSTLGFGLRVASTATESGRRSVGLYAASQTSIIIAPIFICATLYLLLAHLIQLCLPAGPDRVFLGVSPSWLGKVFVTSDVVSFLAQSVGGMTMMSAGLADTGSRKDTGRAILMVGLGCQLATFTVFMVVLGLFCLRVRGGHEGEGGIKGVGGGNERDYGFNPLVKQVVKGMWIASVLVEVSDAYLLLPANVGIRESQANVVADALYLPND
ncbi:hypothetical protein PMZ80_007406 [Knufia obscura]|uniref:Uncharacterized protein n=1 Tax=Knufia obscura TaxID=1635080 RepID=A0ABR0RH86_9EURO|nr:hypothetical protein PMZ80_007406 [Knufia obscura]